MVGSLLCINASNLLTKTWSDIDLQNSNDYAVIKGHIMAPSVTGGSESLILERHTMSFWCTDGKRHEFDYLCDEEGKSKGLLPNHRVNALIHAGRFTCHDFDDIDSSRNQEMKDTWGPNYCVGDVYFILPDGCPSLDLSVFGNNPIAFILKDRTASNRMKREHGIKVASNMLNPRMKKPVPSHFSGSISEFLEVINKGEWVFVDYNVMPQRCDDHSYKAMLGSWGYLRG